jgi:hypothetical protein
MASQVKKYLINLFAKFQFWNAKKTIKLNEDFEFYESEGDLFLMKIKTGKFKDVIFSISELKVREDDDGAVLDFTTRIHNSPDKTLDTDNKDFIKYINNVVRILLSESVEEMIRNEQRGVVGSNQLDEEREVYEEDSSISEERVSKRKSRKAAVDRDSEVHTEVQQPTKRRSNTAVTRRRTESKRTGV